VRDRLGSALFLGVLGCGARHEDDVIVSACLVSTDASALPMAEIVFGSTFDPDCQWVPETSCEVSLEGDVLVVHGEASWRHPSAGGVGSGRKRRLPKWLSGRGGGDALWKLKRCGGWLIPRRS